MVIVPCCHTPLSCVRTLLYVRTACSCRHWQHAVNFKLKLITDCTSSMVLNFQLDYILCCSVFQLKRVFTAWTDTSGWRFCSHAVLFGPSPIRLWEFHDPGYRRKPFKHEVHTARCDCSLLKQVRHWRSSRAVIANARSLCIIAAVNNVTSFVWWVTRLCSCRDCFFLFIMICCVASYGVFLLQPLSFLRRYFSIIY